jgi:hypothetical protein
MRCHVTSVAQNAKTVAATASEREGDVRIKIKHQAARFSCKSEQTKFLLQNKF